MVSTEALLLYVHLFVAGALLFLLTSGIVEQKAQWKYETAFINHHRDKISKMGDKDFLPLTFAQRETEHLLSLCQQYASNCMRRFSSTAFQPEVEVHYLAFRRLTPRHPPVRTEVIRCGGNHAIIEAGDGVSGYMLERYVPFERNLDLGRTFFNIDAKFNYELVAQRSIEENKLPDRDEDEPVIMAPRQTSSYAPLATTDDPDHSNKKDC